ncbi:MAG: aldo/keto reductase [Clostridia bacterium]|nr:aldo/keto reductase [Clostridia bacterium]
MSNLFPEAKKKLGFGCMRLPMKDGEVVHEDFCKMVDAFMGAGFNYFDTARVYLNGKSETAIRECVAKRYPRDSFVVANKLSQSCFEKEEDILPFFESQLEALGVDYIDVYLLHALNRDNYEKKYTPTHAFEIVEELVRQGKVRHYGFSFHDNAETLDKILTEHPSVEFVQLQFNYLDFEDEGVQSKLCYEVCRRHGKKVIVMEPVRGGRLANLPPVAKKYFDELGEMSPASYALRFAAGFEGIEMVLSGMSNIEQVEDNISFMADVVPLNESETEAVGKVCDILKNQGVVACTGCNYCVDGCLMSINIPAYFAYTNAKALGLEAEEYSGVSPEECVECGQCETACPQHLKIRELLKK